MNLLWSHFTFPVLCPVVTSPHHPGGARTVPVLRQVSGWFTSWSAAPQTALWPCPLQRCHLDTHPCQGLFIYVCVSVCFHDLAAMKKKKGDDILKMRINEVIDSEQAWEMVWNRKRTYCLLVQEIFSARKIGTNRHWNTKQADPDFLVAFCSNVTKEVVVDRRRSLLVTQGEDKRTRPKETKRKSDIWKDPRTGQRCVGPLSLLALNWMWVFLAFSRGKSALASIIFQTSQLSCPLPFDLEMWLALGRSSTELQGLLELRRNKKQANSRVKRM